MLDNRLKMYKDMLNNRSRFLDDIRSTWLGTTRLFEAFLSILNKVGKIFGITFKGNAGKSVQFLDVTTTLINKTIETTMFVKPTDSSRYLNRRSDHSQHTFRGIPFSQFRRAVVICSNFGEKINCIERMRGNL